MSNRIGALACLLALHPGSGIASQHQIVKVYLDNGNPGTALPVGENYLVHAEGVNCPKNVASCTFVMSVMDQICGGSPSGIQFRIILTVDDVSIDGGNWVPSFRESDQQCSGGDWSDNFVVGPGRHQVKLYTYYDYDRASATQGPWAVNYTVTTP